MTESSESRNRFCTECGAELKPDQQFCTNCGTPVKPVAQTEDAKAAPVVPDATPASEAPAPAVTAPAQTAETAAPVAAATAAVPAAQPAPADATAAPKKSKTGIIIGVIIAIAIVVAAIIVCVTLLTNNANESEVADEPSTEAAEEAEPEEDFDDIELPNELVTVYAVVDKITYPSFAINYPDGWKITDHECVSGKENFTIENKSGDAKIVYESGFETVPVAHPPLITDVKEVADSDFEPGLVQANDHRSLGEFMVGQVDLSWNNGIGSGSSANPRTYTTSYAVIPKAAVDNTSLIYTGEGTIGFDYTRIISVECQIPDGGFDAKTNAEVIAALSSFRIVEYSDAEAYYRANPLSGSSKTNADYVIPDSSTRVLSSSELRNMSDYELFLARNEIYARHGRLFQKQELRDHFGSKSWYKGTIAPEDFSDSMLSEIERKNVNTIKSIEESRGSEYLLP